MRRIIPFIIFFTAVTYLFYSPAPMDKIGKTVKKRACYKLRLMDQERLSITLEKIDASFNDHVHATIQKGDSPQKRNLIKKQKHNDFSLALSQQGN